MGTQLDIYIVAGNKMYMKGLVKKQTQCYPKPVAERATLRATHHFCQLGRLCRLDCHLGRGSH